MLGKGIFTNSFDWFRRESLYQQSASCDKVRLDTKTDHERVKDIFVLSKKTEVCQKSYNKLKIVDNESVRNKKY
jgi:hypothetical protein